MLKRMVDYIEVRDIIFKRNLIQPYPWYETMPDDTTTYLIHCTLNKASEQAAEPVHPGNILPDWTGTLWYNFYQVNTIRPIFKELDSAVFLYKPLISYKCRGIDFETHFSNYIVHFYYY